MNDIHMQYSQWTQYVLFSKRVFKTSQKFFIVLILFNFLI